MRRAVGCARATARFPAIADEPVRQTKLACFQNFSLVNAWPAHNQLQPAFIFGRAANLVQSCLQLAHRQMFYSHHPSGASPLQRARLSPRPLARPGATLPEINNAASAI